jgi:heat shock protein HtpX
MDWGLDWGLRARMVATLLGLAALYLGFVFAVGTYLGSVVAVAAVAVVVVALQVRYGSRLTLRAVGARTVSAADRPALHDRVSRLARQADLPVPEVAVIDSATPNAMATGLRPGSATVVVTEGLVTDLDDAELDAVIAHELAHVSNRDVALLTTVTALTAVAAFVVRNFWWFGDGDAGGEGDGFGLVLGVVAASAVVWALGSLLSRAVSRYREFAADRGAAAVTGDPAALASALRTVEGAEPDGDLRAEGARALLFADTDSGDGGRLTTSLQRLVDTHPPVETRVDRLRSLQADRLD